MNYKKFISSAFIIAVIALSLFGCSKAKPEAAVSSTSSVTDKNISAQTESDDDMFTDRDYDNSYDEKNAVKINLEDNSSSCDSQNVSISDNTITIGAEGTYILSGNLSNGQIKIETDNTVKIQLVLNEVAINCDTSAAIYIKQADKVFITLADGTINSLSNKKEFSTIDDNHIDSVLFSKSNVTFNGSGELTVNAKYGHGIVSKGDLKFISGNYIINTAESAIQGKDSVRIAGGTFNLTAAKDGIHSENNDENNEDKGFVYIIAGVINISAGDDGIHAGRNLTVNGGTINISESNEGIEGQTINISGGKFSIKSEDDGFNASSGSSNDTNDIGMENPFSSDESCSITISGGTITIDANGDGIDSNGNITVTGGEIYIEGPTSNGDSALDFNQTATISGGIVIAVGSAGMAENFSNGTQCSMLINIAGSAGDTITLKDNSGIEILSYKANKSYECVIISCPEITKGETYTVKSESQETEVTMTDTIYVSNSIGSNKMDGGNNQMDRGQMDGKGPMGKGNMNMDRPQ